MYGKKSVSYGTGATGHLGDDTEIELEDNILRGVARIDERNLGYCKWLNLDGSSVTSLATTNLSRLEYLCLSSTRIKSLDTSFFVNMDALYLKNTLLS